MIVIYAPTKNRFLDIPFLSSLGLSIYVFDKNNVAHSKSLKRARKIHLIRFDNEDKIGLLNYIDYPSEKIIENYLSSLQLDTAYRRLSRFYERIDNLHQKTRPLVGFNIQLFLLRISVCFLSIKSRKT